MQQFLPFFSFAGRMNRQRYWVTSILVNLAFLALGLTAATIPTLGLVLMIPGGLVGVWVGLAAAARRLHDRNKSAWWLLIMYGPVLLFSAMGAAMTATGSAISGIGSLFSIWIFVELGCLKGTTGPNRFGDDPLQPSPAEVFA